MQGICATCPVEIDIMLVAKGQVVLCASVICIATPLDPFRMEYHANVPPKGIQANETMDKGEKLATLYPK